MFFFHSVNIYDSPSSAQPTPHPYYNTSMHIPFLTFNLSLCFCVSTSLCKTFLYQISNSLIFLSVSALNGTEYDGRVIKGEEAVSKQH